MKIDDLSTHVAFLRGLLVESKRNFLVAFDASKSV